jgi:hypothetical protein
MVNTNEIGACLTRFTAIWPRKRAEAELDEWQRVFRPLDSTLTFAAFDELRDALDFPPSIADFRSAYRLAEATNRDERLALPSGNANPDDTLRDLYGEDQTSWVYCWRCDMAITLEGRATMKGVGYDAGRGLYHRSCPKGGSAPLIPSWEKSPRDEGFRKRHITIGPNVDPSPYGHE